MTRKEEIKEAAKSAIMYDDFEEGCIGDTYFQIGAKWADKTMLDKAIKFFQSKSKHGMIEENINVFIDEFCKVMEE